MQVTKQLFVVYVLTTICASAAPINDHFLDEISAYKLKVQQKGLIKFNNEKKGNIRNKI